MEVVATDVHEIVALRVLRNYVVESTFSKVANLHTQPNLPEVYCTTDV